MKVFHFLHIRLIPAALFFGSVFLLILHLPPAAAQKEKKADRGKPLIRFPLERMDINTWLKRNGWESKRHDPRRFEVDKDRMRLVSRRDSVMIGTERGFPVDPHAWPVLRLRLHVAKLPRGTDLSKKSGDDAAFRLYAAFDRGRGLFSPPHTIAYTWTEDIEPATVIRSPHFKQLRYLSIGKGVTGKGKRLDGKAGWVVVERNLLEDYRRVFPEDKKRVPPLVGIMLKCDSNNTGTSAEAWLSQLELLPEMSTGKRNGDRPSSVKGRESVWKNPGKSE